MAILNIAPLNIGNVGNAPTQYMIYTSDTLAKVTTAGYLNTSDSIFSFSSNDYAWVTTTDSGTQPCQITVTNGEVTLSTYSIASVTLIGNPTRGLTVNQSPVGTWTISLSQDLRSVGYPTFANLNITGLSGFFNATSALVLSDTSTGELSYLTPSATTPLYLSNNLSGSPKWDTINLAGGGISGVLPIANGGTNSSTALSNGLMMISDGGKIVEINENVSAGSYNITNLATPINPTDAVTKAYVDDAIFNQTNLPISNYLTSTLGISVSDGFSIFDNGAGKISVPYATSSTLGICTPDGTTISLSGGNGTTYTQSNITSDSINNVVFATNVYVTISLTSANIYYSSNGTSWTQVVLSGTGFNKVAYGNGLFIACNNTSGLWYSSNGSSWTQVSALSTYGFNDAKFADGIWIALSLGHGIYYSTNGTSWTQSASFTSFSGAYQGLAFNGNTWVALSGSNGGIVYSTNSGTSWTASNLTTGTFGGVAVYNGNWVAGGNNSNGIYYSANGTSWTQSASLTTSSFDFILFANNIWLASGHSTNGLFYSTNNGTTWTQVTGAPTTVNCHDLFYANGLFVAAFGQSSGIYYSSNGTAWTQATGSTTNTMNSILYANGIWIATANTVGIWYSKTGILSVINAPDVTVTSTTTNANYFPTFVPSSTTGSQALYLSSAWYFNPNTDLMNINGGLSIGAYAGTAPASGGMLMSGGLGINTGNNNNIGIYLGNTYGSWANGVISLQGNCTGVRDAYAFGGNNTYNGTDVAGISILTSINPANATPSTGKAMWIYPTFSIANGVTVGTSYGLHVDAGSYTLTGTGAITNAYGLYVNAPPSGTNKVAAYFDNFSVGYTGIVPPTTGAIIQGKVGIGTSAPNSAFSLYNNGLGYDNNHYYQDTVSTSGSAITITGGKSQNITLNAATVTITMPSLPSSGFETEFILNLIQDGTGGRAVVWAGSPTITWAAGTPPNINTIAGTSTYISFRGTSTGWVGFASSTGLGVTNGSNAAAGYIGEIVTSTVASGSAVSLTNNTAANITSITLSPGNWVISGNIVFVPAGSTIPTSFVGSASTTSATQATAPNGGCYFQHQSTYTTGAQQAYPTGQTTVQITATTTYYLVATALFTVSTMTAYGSITAGRYY